jgi:hypothetical protein
MPFLFSAHVKRRPGSCHKRGWFWAGCGRTSAGLYLVMIGIAPSTGGDAIKIVIGSLIALAVIGYVASQWKKFD